MKTYNNNKYLNLFYYLGLFVAPLLLLFKIQKYSVDLPHWEEWTLLLHTFMNYDSSSFLELFWYGGEHIILIPKIFLYSLGVISDINFTVFHLGNFLIYFFTYLILLRVLFQNIHAVQKKILVIGIIFSIQIFTHSPSGVYLWAMSSYIFFNLLFAVLALYFCTYSKDHYNKLFLSITFIICSVLSSLNGIILFIIIFIYFLFNSNIGKIPRILGQFLSPILLLFSINIYNMHANHDHSSHQIILFKNGIISFLKYILLYLGSVLSSSNIDKGIYVGFFGIFISCYLFFIVIYYKINWKNHLFFILLYLYILGTAIITALAREKDFGFEQGATDRYMIFAVFYWCSISYFLLVSSNVRFMVGIVNKILLLLILFFSITSSKSHWNDFLSIYNTRISVQKELLNDKYTDNLGHIYPSGKYNLPRDSLEYIKKNKFSLFREK